MILRLPYGRETVTADLRGLRCRLLEPGAPRGYADPGGLAAAALDAPMDGSPLVELARGKRRVVVLVPDATRKAFLPRVLPQVLERLERGGVTMKRVTVLVACGTHPAVGGAALQELVGALPAGVCVTQHDCRSARSLAAAGTLASGLTVRLSRAVLEADLVVAVSPLAHHYFAGFTGGPKMVFPGVAGYEEIQANHAKVIDVSMRPPRRHPACEPGRLRGNPVAEEIAEAAALRPPDLALLLVKGRDGLPCWCGAGSLGSVFPAGIARVRRWFEVEPELFSRVIVTAGGSPADDTIIQAHKALDAACRFAADGAEVLLVASCGQGAGSPDMAPFLDDPRPASILARLAERYVQYGHTTLRLVEKTERVRVAWCSALAADLVERLGARVAENVQAVLDRWREEAGGDAVGVMPGAAVYPRSEGTYAYRAE